VSKAYTLPFVVLIERRYLLESYYEDWLKALEKTLLGILSVLHAEVTFEKRFILAGELERLKKEYNREKEILNGS